MCGIPLDAVGIFPAQLEAHGYGPVRTKPLIAAVAHLKCGARKKATPVPLSLLVSHSQQPSSLPRLSSAADEKLFCERLEPTSHTAETISVAYPAAHAELQLRVRHVVPAQKRMRTRIVHRGHPLVAHVSVYGELPTAHANVPCGVV